MPDSAHEGKLIVRRIIDITVLLLKQRTNIELELFFRVYHCH